MIPALNEPYIGSFVARVGEHVDRVIVVDELHGTDLDTGAIASRSGADAVYSRANCLRAAVELGWAHTAKHDSVITLDGDGAQLPAEIPQLLAGITDVVIGSRFVPGGAYLGRYRRRLASRAFGIACQARTGLPIKDWGGGFRCYHNGSARRLIGNRSYGHAYQAETLRHAHSMGMTISETPTTYLETHSTLTVSGVTEALRSLLTSV